MPWANASFFALQKNEQIPQYQHIQCSTEVPDGFASYELMIPFKDSLFLLTNQ